MALPLPSNAGLDSLSAIFGLPTTGLPPGLPYSINISPSDVTIFLSLQSAYSASVASASSAAAASAAGLITSPTDAAPHTTVTPDVYDASTMTAWLDSLQGTDFPLLSDCVFEVFADAFASVDVDSCPYKTGDITSRADCLCSSHGRDVVTGVFAATACPYNGYDYASKAVLSLCSNVAGVIVPASDTPATVSATATASVPHPSSSRAQLFTFSQPIPTGSDIWGWRTADLTATDILVTARPSANTGVPTPKTISSVSLEPQNGSGGLLLGGAASHIGPWSISGFGIFGGLIIGLGTAALGAMILS